MSTARMDVLYCFAARITTEQCPPSNGNVAGALAINQAEPTPIVSKLDSKLRRFLCF